MTTPKKPRTKTIEIPEQPSDRSAEQHRMALRRKVEMFYDIQRLRLQCAGRTYKRADGTEIQLHEVDQIVLEGRAAELQASERSALRDVEAHLKTMPFYNNVLSDKVRFRGIGPTMAGVILSSFDIVREDTVSKMWAFAGLAPIAARRCSTCHAVVEPASHVGDMVGLYQHAKERPRPVKDGEAAPKEPKEKCSLMVAPANTYESGKSARPVKGEKLHYNAWLRTKLVGVLAPVLLKVGSPFKKVYDDYKLRKTSAGWGRSDAHRHQAAMRYMIKMLLLDIWRDWRAAEGLVVRPSYHEEKLGHVHGGAPRALPVVEEEPSMDPAVLAELETLDVTSDTV